MLCKSSPCNPCHSWTSTSGPPMTENIGQTQQTQQNIHMPSICNGNRSSLQSYMVIWWSRLPRHVRYHTEMLRCRTRPVSSHGWMSIDLNCTPIADHDLAERWHVMAKWSFFDITRSAAWSFWFNWGSLDVWWSLRMRHCLSLMANSHRYCIHVHTSYTHVYNVMLCVLVVRLKPCAKMCVCVIVCVCAATCTEIRLHMIYYDILWYILIHIQNNM